MHFFNNRVLCENGLIDGRQRIDDERSIWSKKRTGGRRVLSISSCFFVGVLVQLQPQSTTCATEMGNTLLKVRRNHF